MSGLSRRFLNVIVENRSAGVQTLRCVDLVRHKLFNTKPPPPTTGGLKKKKKQAFKTEKMLPLPTPRPSSSFSMRASSGQGRMHCCPAPADGRVLCLDKPSGRSLLMEADTSWPRIVMMPPLQPKLDPISLYIPDPDCTAKHDDPHLLQLDDDIAAAATGGGGGTFFIMDRIIASKLGRPEEEEAAASCRHLFEAFVYRNPNYTFLPSMCWNCDPLPPPPPYVHRDRDRDRDDNTSSLEISSYAVVKDDRSGGSHICISVDGVGTY